MSEEQQTINTDSTALMPQYQTAGESQDKTIATLPPSEKSLLAELDVTRHTGEQYFQKTSAREAAALYDIIEHSTQVITFVMNGFKLDSESQQEEAEIKAKFLALNKILAKIQREWLTCQKDIETVAQLVSALMQKYKNFVTGDGAKIRWTAAYTQEIRNTIESTLSQQADQCKVLYDLEAEVREMLQDVAQMLDKKSNSFKGKVEEAKNQEAKIKADTISNNEKVQQLQKDLDEKTTAHIVVSCEYDEFVVARAGLEALLEDAKARMKEADLQYKTSLEMASNARIELEKEKKRLQEDFNGSIMNHRKAEEHFQAQILKTEKMLMKLSNERIDLVSEQQVQSATGKAGPPLVHYHFMMDESRSMNSSFLSSFGQLFGINNPSRWQACEAYFQEFVQTAQNKDFLISIVAFSDVTRVICEGKKVKDLAKQKDILGKIKAGPATRFAPALREAHEIALKYTGYQDVYVLLTDGHGNDQQESINAITAIKNSRHELQAKPLFFGIGMGKQSNDAQLLAISQVLNNCPNYVVAGIVLTPFVHKVTEDGNTAKQMTELFKHISYATTNAVDVIDTRMQALQANKERLIEEKKNCANGKLKSSEAAVQVVKEYRESFEKTVLKELDGEKDHYLQVLELRKKVAQEQQEEVTKAKKEEQLAQHRKQALKDEIDIIKQDLENAQRLKVDLSKFLQDNAKAMMKAYEEENKVPDQQAADLHVKHASVLQMQLQKGNGYLAKAQEFYKMINKILSMLLKTEAQVPIVAQSLPLDALKTRMLEDYSRHDPSKYESIKEDELNCYENFEITTEWGSDQEDNEGHKSEENAANGVSNRAEYFNYMKNFKWEDKDVTSFDSSKFLVAVMTQALELDAVGMRQLIAIFEANTFEAVMENVGQSITDPSLEVLTLQNLTKKLKILFNNNLRISEGQLKKQKTKYENLTKAIKKRKGLITALEEECDEEKQNIAKLKKAVDKKSTDVLKKQHAKNQKALDKKVKQFDDEHADIDKQYATQKAKYEAKRAKIEEKTEGEDDTEALQALDDAWAKTQEKLQDKRDKLETLNEEIQEAERDLADEADGIEDPSGALKFKMEEQEKRLAKIAKKVAKNKLVKPKVPVLEDRIERIQSSVEDQKVNIENNCDMASLIINKLRTVGKNIYQKEIDRVCSALIKELDDQMGSIYNPLSVFLNPAEMNLAITEAKEEAMITQSEQVLAIQM